MIGRQRTYIAIRRAYVPRVWPTTLACAPISFAIAITTPWYLALPATIIAAWTLGNGRFWIWKRRHPTITGQELIQDMRDAAPFN